MPDTSIPIIDLSDRTVPIVEAGRIDRDLKRLVALGAPVAPGVNPAGMFDQSMQRLGKAYANITK